MDGEYIHWDKLRHLGPPDGVSAELWWLGIKLRRRSQFRPVPLEDVSGRRFVYAVPDPVPEHLHEVDLGAGGSIEMTRAASQSEAWDRYYVRSLVEEAITSSQLEGAATTRKVAKEMIRSGRPPSDRSERMILNNYRTMERIGSLKNEELSAALVLDLHRLVTDETLDDATAAGRYRRANERIDVGDLYGNVFHVPPPADELPERVAAMCRFANGQGDTAFMHPAIRAIILHFWLAYDHPFVDGNGRTARALFYWSMLRSGYWLSEFVSISQVILKAPAKYGRAFLYTETDDNDLTYFIVYHMDVFRRAVDELHRYIDRRTKRVAALESRLAGLQRLNHRQRALVSHALRHPGYEYTIFGHARTHRVVHRTARTDLMELVDRGLFSVDRVGRRYVYRAAPDLEGRLERS